MTTLLSILRYIRDIRKSLGPGLRLTLLSCLCIQEREIRSQLYLMSVLQMQLQARPVFASFVISREKRWPLYCRTSNRDRKFTILTCSGFGYVIKNNNAKYFIWI